MANSVFLQFAPNHQSLARLQQSEHVLEGLFSPFKLRSACAAFMACVPCIRKCALPPPSVCCDTQPPGRFAMIQPGYRIMCLPHCTLLIMLYTAPGSAQPIK
ncbi:unnamed protein product [Effrenium voratum]|uniref:Uncharacterized protein n=1 Tax=Effrenium voratum TaxID=2562239 RepID=A0AA36I1W0_9DINO|nr:unnamed protein product [Effrenium voratum]